MDWISAEEREPECPCLACDEWNPAFVLEAMVVQTDESGKKSYYDGMSFDFSTGRFETFSLDGEEYELKKEIKFWMPLPMTPYGYNGTSNDCDVRKKIKHIHD